MTTVAVAQYPIALPRHWDDFADNVSHWVEKASKAGASLIVFPEYAGMELVSLLPDDIQNKLNIQLLHLQQFYDDYVALFRELAKKFAIYILAGSFPVQTQDNKYRNRAALFGTEGYIGHQDKLVMTRFEREQWNISPGEHTDVFVTDIGTIGITICYDSEFPLIARRQAEAGADILLVPSCTDTAAGYHRVQTAARARALENQCFVLHSPLVGEAPNNPAVIKNVGSAGIYCPPDSDLSESGVWAGKENEASGLLISDIDPKVTKKLRTQGQVTTYADWPKQWQLSGP